ncbi:hypothetical protein A7U60_g7805 [Sanghuangporus baumii]|uniref:Uncharacterized protein n=1 Tax=Sanghuangporus baumii TaxID=108892 RepID=A0A9Q5HSK5_SANBA|nr:hypothetical protein A7U60_g7805 [Sanghuangporus baumii]
MSYKSTINAEASALQRQVEDCQGRYDSAQEALNELSAVVKTQSGDTKKKTDDAMVSARSRMNTARTACDRANDEFLGKGTVLNIKSELERQFPSLGDLKSRMLTVDAIKNAVSPARPLPIEDHRKAMKSSYHGMPAGGLVLDLRVWIELLRENSRNSYRMKVSSMLVDCRIVLTNSERR